MVETHPDVAAGIVEQIPELGSRRSGEMGAGRLCGRARRFARRRPLARLHRSLFAARDAGLLPVHRMGRRAAVVERQGGLNGISYYGINQWHVASLQPPHLAAMCIWEGAADWYRDMTHHGGILSTFWDNWFDMQVKTVQYGCGEKGRRSRVTGQLVCGDELLSDEDARAEPQRLRQGDTRASARRRLPQGALAEVGQGHGAVSVGRELGRAGPASARQLRGLHARARRNTNGSKRTASSTGRISTPTTA